MKKLFLSAALLALACSSQLAAISTYSVTVDCGSPWTGTHTIYASDSGMSSKYYGVMLWDSSNNPVGRSTYTPKVNSSTYNLTLQFGSGSFCGTIHLRGSFGSSDTSSWLDWYPQVVDYNTITHTLGGSYSQRTVSGAGTFASDIAGAVQINASTSDCSGYAYEYFAPDSGELTITLPSGCSGYVVSATVPVAYGGGYPSGSVPIGTFSVVSGFITLYSDDRSW